MLTATCEPNVTCDRSGPTRVCNVLKRFNNCKSPLPAITLKNQMFIKTNKKFDCFTIARERTSVEITNSNVELSGV